MTSLPEREPPKDWWLENACRTAAYRSLSQKGRVGRFFSPAHSWGLLDAGSTPPRCSGEPSGRRPYDSAIRVMLRRWLVVGPLNGL